MTILSGSVLKGVLFQVPVQVPPALQESSHTTTSSHLLSKPVLTRTLTQKTQIPTNRYSHKLVSAEKPTIRFYTHSPKILKHSRILGRKKTQSLILPMVLISFFVLCFHIPMSWILVYVLRMGSSGEAIAICVSNWLYVAFLTLYVKFSASCKDSRLSFSVEAFSGIGEFFRLAIPSAAMVCLKWWSVKVLILMSGLLANPKLETSVLSICQTISILHLTVPYRIGAAASTRVSNELGAGNPGSARVVVRAVMFLAVAETVTISILLFCFRRVLGRAFSSEKQVIDYIAVMTPLICVSTVTDSLQAAISGIARRCGWQWVGAYVNLGAFYLVGIPVAVVLGFVDHLKAKGFWIGIVIGSILQSIVLSLITYFTDWEKQANEARERVANT
ncbi:hypothetical protein ABFX02_12G028000 [Erythranthe guttata]